MILEVLDEGLHRRRRKRRRFLQDRDAGGRLRLGLRGSVVMNAVAFEQRLGRL